MKKILGILLAFCFLMSVTVASVSAADNVIVKKVDKTVVKKVDKVVIKKIDKFNKHDDRNKFDKRNYKIVFKMVKIPGHWDKKVIKEVVYKNHQKIVIKKVVKVWVPAKWIKVPVKVPVNNDNGHHR
jgi:hypothetical protein